MDSLTGTGRFRLRPIQWLLALVVLLLAALWSGILFDLERARQVAHERATDNLGNLTLAFAKEIESSIKTIDVTLVDLREHWQGDAALFRQALNLRQSYLKDELILQIAIIDARGTLVFSSLESPTRPLDLSDREHFRVHAERRYDALFISQPVRGRVSGRWLIQFTRPIYDRQGEFRGVIALSVPPEYFYRFYRAIKMPGDGVISLQRDGGEILARYPAPEQAIGKVIHSAPFRDPEAAEAGVFSKTAEIDGIDRLYAWRKMPRYQLVVILGYSLDSIEAGFAAQHSRPLLAGCALSLLILLLAWLRLRALQLREQAERQLSENEQRWRYALEAAGDGVWDWQIGSQRVIFSERWKTMLGYAPDEIANLLDEWEHRVHPDDIPRVRKDLAAHIGGQTPIYHAAYRMLHKDGHWLWVLDRGMVLERSPDGQARRMVGTHTDISQQKMLEDQLKALATTDPLTGVANRRHFLERLREEYLRIQRYPEARCCVLMADLDHFKRINDQYGHAVGDRALQHFSSLLTQESRETDLCGRLGGEEFALLLPETDSQDALLFARRLCRRLRETPLLADDHQITITVSIGISRIRPDDRQPEEALQHADRALYRAKHTGRDRAEISE
ncbi:diguanylate cyclase [Dechloromonas sp. ZY10]|uniref:diguanylate cyclase n=1 Tax=Dechloromonas aquae TaxID=2664436 RepID=UPI0035285ACB